MARMNAERIPDASSFRDAADGGPARRAHGVLHRARVHAGRHLQLSRSRNHLAHHLICRRTQNAVLDGGVRQRLDHHGDERGRATAHRARNRQQAGLDLDGAAEQAQQRIHQLVVVVRERRGLFAGDHALVDGDGRIGNRRQVARPRNHALVRLAIPTGGNREHDLAHKSLCQGGQHALDHVRLDRDDHHIGRLDDRHCIGQGAHAARVAARNQGLVTPRAGAQALWRYLAGGDPDPSAMALAMLPNPIKPILTLLTSMSNILFEVHHDAPHSNAKGRSQSPAPRYAGNRNVWRDP